ncbi:BRD4-interacting chromatin-remodeling complex-associated protein-like isoform X5 [Penaeus japonicus]|uniref:BRD4-interacting chromatin-remodeling complex-associated protein-like isoform X5 n=1 Tax=Penaeus japonicus TaxID=27405 RepID=UPI001C713CC0|nr:BRD4-interacting chromatin-remodeling complex-associated protein-like isoform X5 [Penaeus japonicus]
MKVLVLAAVVAAVASLPQSPQEHVIQERSYPAPVYAPPPPPPPPSKGKGGGGGGKGFFDFDIFKGIKDLFSFGKGKGGGQEYHPAPRPSYGPPPPPPKGNYGPPPSPPKGNYGPPPKAPFPSKGHGKGQGKGHGKGSHGPPPRPIAPPKGHYGPPPPAPPKGQYGPPPAPPKGQYGPPPAPPKGHYGPPPPAPPKGQYGPPPPRPKGNYGPPPPRPKGNYGPPPPRPKGNYGPPPPPPKGQYGPPPPRPVSPPHGSYAPPPTPVAPSPSYGVPQAPQPGYGAPKPGDIIAPSVPVPAAPVPVPSGNYGPPPIPLPVPVPSGNYGPPPVPSGNYGPPPVPAPIPAPVPVPSGNYGPPPVPAPVPVPSDNYVLPPIPVAPVPVPSDNYAPPPVPVAPVPVPTENYGIPPAPVAPAPVPIAPAPIPTGSYNPPPSPSAPLPDLNRPLPTKPDCEACDQAPWVPMEITGPAVVAPVAPVAPVGPAPVDIIVPGREISSPGIIDISPPAPAFDIRVNVDAPVEDEPIFIVDSDVGRDPRVIEGGVSLPLNNEVIFVAEEPAPQTITVVSDPIDEPVFITEDVFTTGVNLLPEDSVRDSFDIAPAVFETEGPTIVNDVSFGVPLPDITFSLSEPQIVNEGQPIFISSSEGSPGFPEVVSVSNAEFQSVGEPTFLSVSEPEVLTVSQPDVPAVYETPATFLAENPLTIEDFIVADEPIDFDTTIPDTAIRVGDFATEPQVIDLGVTTSVGQAQFVDESVGFAQNPSSVGVSLPEILAVSQPEVVSVSEPEILTVSQPDDQSQLTATLLDPAGDAPFSVIQLEDAQPPTQTFLSDTRSQGGLQDTSALGGVPLPGLSSPQFIGSNQGEAGGSQVLSISEPQVFSVSQPESVSISEPQVVSVGQPQGDQAVSAPQSNIQQAVLTMVIPNAPDIFTPQADGILVSSGIPQSSLPDIRSEGVFQGAPAQAGVPLPGLSSPQFIGSSQGEFGGSEVLSISEPQVVFVSQPESVSISEPQVVSVEQPQAGQALPGSNIQQAVLSNVVSNAPDFFTPQADGILVSGGIPLSAVSQPQNIPRDSGASQITQVFPSVGNLGPVSTGGVSLSETAPQGNFASAQDFPPPPAFPAVETAEVAPQAFGSGSIVQVPLSGSGSVGQDASIFPGNAGQSQVIPVSPVQFNDVAEPQLLQSFSSAAVQDAIGVPLAATSPQVKTPDMSALPLADPSFSSSPSFPPFSQEPQQVAPPSNVLLDSAAPDVIQEIPSPIVSAVDVRAGSGSGKSFSDAQPQRNNLGFPHRRDPILPFGARLDRRRPGTFFTNTRTGSPLLTTLPTTTTVASTTLSNPPDAPSPASTPLTPVISLMPFIVAPVFTPVVAGPPQDPPALPSTELMPPSDSPGRPSPPPRLQRLFPSQRLIDSLRQEQSSFSSSTSSESSQETSSRTSTSQLLAAAGMLQKVEKSSSNSSNSSSSSKQESSSSSAAFSSKGSSASNAVASSGAAPPSPLRKKKPSPASDPSGEKRGRVLVPNKRRPVLRRPATPITRPRSRVVQTPVSDDYINNFPEAAAPEGFPGEDPEEATIKENLFELKRVN